MNNSIQINTQACTAHKREHITLDDTHFIAVRCALDHALTEPASHAGLTLADTLLSAQYGDKADYRLNLTDLQGLPLIALGMIERIAALSYRGIRPADCLLNGHTLLDRLAETHAAAPAPTAHEQAA